MPTAQPGKASSAWSRERGPQHSLCLGERSVHRTGEGAGGLRGPPGVERPAELSAVPLL